MTHWRIGEKRTNLTLQVLFSLGGAAIGLARTPTQAIPDCRAFARKDEQNMERFLAFHT